MKSLNCSYIRTEHTSPKTETSTSYDHDLPSLHNTQPNQTKMVEFMTTTLKSFTNIFRTNSIRRTNKPRISIMPLTRDKVRATVRSRKRFDGQNWQGFRSGRSSPCTKSGLQSVNIKQKYVQFFTMLSFMYNKLRKKCYKLQVLIDELVIYFNGKKAREYYRDVQEIVAISELLRAHLLGTDHRTLRYETIKQCDGELSKLFFNICYEIYLYKHNRAALVELTAIHRDIEYYSRRLGMLTLTILCCLDLGKIYCQHFEFEKASEEYSKAIKLAVYTGDKYSEELGIDRLGMCEYYKGDMITANFYHSSTDRLSSYDKWKIREYYSNEKEIQKILEQKTKEKSIEEEIKEEFFKHNKENIEFNFDNMVKDNEFTQKNHDAFRHNLKEMIKVNSLRKKVPIIKHVLAKVSRIGEKTYRGKEYYVPKASKFHNHSTQPSQEEFLMSHRSFNRNNVGYQSLKIDKHCKIIDQILNFFINDQRANSPSDIPQERQSSHAEQPQ